MPLPSDSTIATVWPHLTHQRDYVAGVRHKLMICEKLKGNASVKIGITGSGQKPCYRILYKNQNGDIIIDGSYWDNHEALENEFADNSNWSEVSMTFQDVDALMREKHPPKRL